ncbi:MAG: N-acetylmuramoyl-L-alanine amidase [Verrucomicrobiales bacterium]|jgi:N-acetylmuramoyl-L-alanine amidase
MEYSKHAPQLKKWKRCSRAAPVVWGAIAGLIVTLLLPIDVTAEVWESVRYRNRDYVTATSLADFYKFTKSESGREITFTSPTIEMLLVTDSDQIKINGIAFLLSYPAVRVKGEALVSRIDLCKLIDPVLRPSQISEAEDFQTVVIDPGHGGRDSGSIGLVTNEKVYTLDLSKKLFTQLVLRGFKVRFTRVEDEYVTLRERVRRANEYQNAIFVSLHFNAHKSSQPMGIETFAITPPGTRSTGDRNSESETWRGNLRDSESIALATAAHASVIKATGAEDRGVRRARFHVLRGLDMPGILFEGGYITNPEEGMQIDKDAYRAVLAIALADGIESFRAALQRKNQPR